MKLEYDTNKDAEFKPIKIILVIESKDELMELWHRFHVSGEVLKEDIKESTCENVYFPKLCNFVMLWGLLNRTAGERGIREE